MQPVTLDGPTDTELIEHVLRFSRCFYDSFRFKRQRVRMWRFILFVLEKEASNPKREIRDNFSAAEVSRVLGKDIEDVADWAILLVKQFRDKGGEFLEKVRTEGVTSSVQSGHRTPGRPAKNKVFKLSSNFDSSAIEYVRGVITIVMRTQISPLSLDEMLQRKGPELFRHIVEVLKSHYYAAWLKCMDELELSRHQKEEIGNHAPYWVITLVASRERVSNTKKAFTADEFYSETRHALRVANKDEVTKCIDFMAKAGLLSEGENKPRSYKLAESCAAPMQKYIRSLKVAREQLQQLLSRELE